ncbi:aspartate-ammonia ligase [Keratinibaculum paraultunense]|uniref:Aspartate--ammonia ligase n=1 Tax=Keratinibaculum paraultunense TaxID=1278232 RepID=A0A4R3KZG7_9FIRM|nr:aspartate--ammonia ligase [Keratinibaculum paraultunense]QQY78771.1 aspartate--ammonia ligase [Keratinibaculum paraultunense]TCS89544.1 aspartate-ammonia ligase [Keratinibaculum paraultunense]
MDKLDVRETQIAIKLIKDFFERELANSLNLIRVSAPLFVKTDTGLNDNLTGVERPVTFNMRKYNQQLEIIQSLAKWKRIALKKYDFNVGEGIYTDMNAIRPDERLSPIHSIYVDQWDWEKVISKEDRNEDFLKYTVKTIFDVFKKTEKMINGIYPFLEKKLPEEITFITTQELEDLYPCYSPKDRERFIAKKHKAVFLMKIGGKLKSGIPHDKRAPDYDDWELNGDILFWNPVLEDAIELSSMGIRVNKNSLKRQMQEAGREKEMKLSYHKMLLEDKLPQTIGGGIGQSRICMFFLEKKHIGQVQASVWPEDIIEECERNNIFLL